MGSSSAVGQTNRPFAETHAQRWCALRVVHDSIDAEIERALQSEVGLSVREFAVIDALARQPSRTEGHFQMREVAIAIGLSPSATTRLVSRLEDRGLLERFICPTDRRGIYTNVTTAGEKLLRRALPVSNRALATALEGMYSDPDLAPFAKLLTTRPDVDASQ